MVVMGDRVEGLRARRATGHKAEAAIAAHVVAVEDNVEAGAGRAIGVHHLDSSIVMNIGMQSWNPSM